MNKKHNINYETIIIKGNSLSDAYENVRKEIGSNAMIQECRNAVEKSTSGLGQKSIFEIVVVKPGSLIKKQMKTSNRFGNE